MGDNHPRGLQFRIEVEKKRSNFRFENDGHEFLLGVIEEKFVWEFEHIISAYKFIKSLQPPSITPTKFREEIRSKTKKIKDVINWFEKKSKFNI